jgi:hypothetical protein
MNFELIGQLVRLRYKLLWAKTRTRNGKIALFMAGYLLLVPVAAMLAAGGIGTGIAAVRSGKAEMIAQGVLTGLFAWALITSVMLGFGMNAVFADAELRRYPLNAIERRFARHFTGIADPYWFLFFALYLGLAFGLYVAGVGSFPLGAIAALLLWTCNYLAARVTGLLLDQVMARRGGSMALPALMITFCFLPGLAVPAIQKNPAAREAALSALGFTPTFGGGSLMTRTGSEALAGAGALVLWLALLAGLLAVLEKYPPKARVAQASRIRFDSPFLRAGALFGPRYAPLAAHWIQFFASCKRFRLQYVMALPMIPVLLFFWTKQSHGSDPFVSAAGIFGVAAVAPVAAMMVNVFGYTGSGFRRYLLFPSDPGMALRAGSYVLLALSAAPLAVATLLWILFKPVDVRGVVMLLASGIAAMFLFHSAGLWATIYSPRRSDPNQTMGNDLSLAGNLIIIGGMMTLLFGTRAASKLWKGCLSPDQWLIAIIVAAASAWVYFASLRRAATALAARRERLLAIMEGRS